MTTTTTSDVAARVANAARRFLDALEPAQRRVTAFPFTAEGERTRFFYTPTDHGGLSFTAMTPQQHSAAMSLLSSSMSQGAYSTAATIMGLENVLAGVEGFVDFDHDSADVRTRDPNRYQVSVFGTPGEEPWGWRFGGHHVSVSLIAAEGQVRLLPSFLGANPAHYHGVGENEVRVLAAEEDLGRELVRMLDEEQRAKAVLSEIAPPDLVTTNRSELTAPIRTEPIPWTIWRRNAQDLRQHELDRARSRFDPLSEDHLSALEYTSESKGIAASALDGAQREVLQALLNQYVARMPDGVLEVEQARIEAIDDASISFAWAGGLEPVEGHYYRIQAPNLFIEYDNTQNGANHIHTVWRDPQRDFGRDLLAEHYAAAH